MIHLAVFLILLMSPDIVLAQEAQWYLSDGAAIRYSATNEQTGRTSDWALSVQQSPGIETAIHYKNGSPIKSWLRYKDSSGMLIKEAVEEDSRIIEERLFGPDGLPKLERFFLSDGEVEETHYIREHGRLVSSTRFLNGEEVGSLV